MTFTSSPELPQDEILARLIFQKGIGELSPLQVARLAAAARSSLAGRGACSAGSARRPASTTSTSSPTRRAQAAVAAGRYISDNVYLGVQQGAARDSSRVTIDLDVTKNVKARAGMGTDGSSSLGIFFEKEYETGFGAREQLPCRLTSRVAGCAVGGAWPWARQASDLPSLCSA